MDGKTIGDKSVREKAWEYYRFVNLLFRRTQLPKTKPQILRVRVILIPTRLVCPFG